MPLFLLRQQRLHLDRYRPAGLLCTRLALESGWQDGSGERLEPHLVWEVRAVLQFESPLRRAGVAFVLPANLIISRKRSLAATRRQRGSGLFLNRGVDRYKLAYTHRRSVFLARLKRLFN